MKRRASLTLTTVDIEHEVLLEGSIRVYQRPCDFCDTLTPIPPKEVLDAFLKAGRFTVEPNLAGDKAYGKFQPEGWELLGPSSWACPACVKLAEAALGTRGECPPIVDGACSRCGRSAYACACLGKR